MSPTKSVTTSRDSDPTDLENQNKEIVTAMWDCVYRRDWERLENHLTKECVFEDMPTPDAGARGGENIIARLRIGFDLIEGFEHHINQIIAEGDNVIVEHRERWHFRTGEIVENNLVSVHQVSDGKVSLWRDYWDINSMLSHAPQWWIEAVAAASPRDFS